MPEDAFWRNLALEEAHTWLCPQGHRHVTWGPVPQEESMERCTDCFPPFWIGDNCVLVVRVVSGVPFDYVKKILG